MAQLAKSSSLTFSIYMSKVIDHGRIEVAEFYILCTFIEDYYQQKKELRKEQVDIDKVMKKHK